jgi:glycosyltransferase involved in cell wall biosynthesis
MKIAIVHNTYQRPGGEDVTVAAETALLESRGHKVVRYTRSNDEIAALSGPKRLLTVKDIVHSERSKREIFDLLKNEKPDVVHVHNTFMVISPSVYEACRQAGVPVVQTLHNYRLLCPGWSLSRDGQVCEECVEHGLWRGVWHGCYRDSKWMTAAVALMLQVHRRRGTWARSVDSYIALTNFAREKFIQGGLPAPAIQVKPNFPEFDPGERAAPGRFALFIGRLDPEKGLKTLLSAWERLRDRIPLVIMGDGPLRQSLEAEVAAKDRSNIAFTGWRERADVVAAIKAASFLVIPSTWYEGFPMTLVEAFACGTPVICSRLGGLQEIVEHHRTGLHFNPGDAGDLASTVASAWAQPSLLSAMGRAARKEFEAKYTAEKNYELLVNIYQQAIAFARRRQQPMDN